MASGDTIAQLSAGGFVPHTGSASYTARNRHGAWQLAASESIVSQDFAVPGWFTASAGITVDIYAMATSATANSTTVQVAIESKAASSDDLDADGFAADVTGTYNAPGTSGQYPAFSVALTNAQADAIAAGRVVRVRIGRTTPDTMSGDLEVFLVVIRET